jgi:glyoxylase-like metal-dependent hydrolase (beta-lactamase superfamily II)
VVASAPAQSISGEWNPITHEDAIERGQGPDLGDYTGYPINDAARLRAESWDASRLTLQEHQCRVHIAPYIYRGPMAVRIWEEKDPETQRVLAIRQYISTYEQNRTIWMDGRAHPPDYAPHTWMGFSTGRWEGNMLTVYTTHLKMGWLKRNGLPESDQATLTEHFIRLEPTLMTHVTIINDPAYMTEPVIRTEEFRLNLDGNINWLWPCEYVLEVNSRPKGAVPNYLPGENQFLKEFYTRWKTPEPGAAGGAATIYPEWRKNMVKVSNPARKENTARPPQGVRDKVEVMPVQGNVSMIVGAGGNITAQVSDQGILLVDSGDKSKTRMVLNELGKLSNKPIRYLINTSIDADHTGGNEIIANLNGPITSLPIQNTPGASLTQSVQILAHDNVSTRMSARNSPTAAPAAAWPTESYINNEKELYFNGEAVRIYHSPPGHTDGDSIVYFRKSDVIATGDLFTPDAYPVIDSKLAGGLQGVIEGLNMILDIAVPAHHEEGGTMIIPGHGRLCDEADLVEYRDMVVIVRDRIQAYKKRGMTLDQVRAARPTMDYDPLYGSTTGPWTTDMFVEAIYKGL